jgi:hypothetical protein
MTSHGQSSAALPEPVWNHVGNDVYQIDDQGNSTWVKVRELSHRPTWEDLLELGERLFNWIYDRWKRDFGTLTGSRLVATLCYAHSEGYTVFQSTIPRGTWHRHLRANGRAEAPTWFSAAYSQPTRGTFREHLHAEDSVEFLCERNTGSFGSAYEETRLIVFGQKSGGQPKQTDLCHDHTRKNPTCETVATLLGIIFPPRQVPAQQLDDAERPSRPLPPPVFPQGWVYEGAGNGVTRVPRSYPGGHSGAGSGQYPFDYTGSNRARAPRAKVDSTTQSDVANLTQVMSTLRVSGSNGGGGGGGSGSTKPQTRGASTVPPSRVSPAKSQVRPPATSQARPPATSPARPPTTSQARPSTRTSAARMSAAPPVPASGGSSKQVNRK